MGGGGVCKLQVWLRSILKSNEQCEICPALFQVGGSKIEMDKNDSFAVKLLLSDSLL